MQRRGGGAGPEVIPNPEHVYTPGQNLVLYYEIYNLNRDEVGQTRYRVTVGVRPVETTPARRPFGAGKQPEVRLTYEQVGDEAWERAHLSVDLAKVTQGRNRLTVLVEDLNGGGKAVKEAIFSNGLP